MAKDPRIEHVIVLMLENRSFDHMLGYLYPRKSRADFNGLQKQRPPFSNPRILADPSDVVEVTPGTPWVTAPDPGHEFDDTTFQLYGADSSDYETEPGGKGFVVSYQQAQQAAVDEERERVERMHADAPGPPDFEVPQDPDGAEIMTCFVGNSLPSLHSLAREFAVCDMWFSSLPGPTWPNRFFVHCATSDNRLNMDPEDLIYPYRMDTIFNRLEAEGESWSVYYHDIPHSLMLRKLRPHREHFKLIYDFQKDVERGQLPAYSFIEPRYFDLLWQKANDQHPPHDVRYGDALIGRIYETLRGNDELWKKSMLVVVYDEHGGFYDHVAPGAATAPGETGSLDPAFAFKRYGLRVPAVIVSPYVEKGAVCHDVFDHSSIPATVKEIFDLEQPLTERDRGANTLTNRVLTRSSPREVALTRIRRTSDTKAFWKNVESEQSADMDLHELNRAFRDDTLSKRPLNAFQSSLLADMSGVAPAPPTAIATEGAGALRAQQIMQWVRLGHVSPDSPGNSADG